MSKDKKILCIDFDGVLHSYVSGWQGPRLIPDPPVEGAMEWLYMKTHNDEYELHIFSSRSRYLGAKRAMKNWIRDNIERYLYNAQPEFKAECHFDDKKTMARWLAEKAVKQMKFPTRKPAAYLTIDDRAICFDGNFNGLNVNIERFKPWYRKGGKNENKG